MIIQFDSELMANQKHADVMAPDKSFEALQSQDGDSLFFSLGTDGAFYLTREASATRTGWDKVDLSSGLAAQLNLPKLTAKSFCVSQNAVSGNIDLALAMTDGAKDYLFLSLGHSNSDFSWSSGTTWTYLPFDAAGFTVSTLSIADIQILQNASGEFFVVDILKNPGDPLQLISRFFLQPTAPVKWYLHDLPVDLSAGSIVSQLGQRAGDAVAGTYTFGKIGDTQELIFTQLYNPWKRLDDQNRAGFTARLTVPAGATAMAVATGPSGFSNVFVAGNGALTAFTPDNQGDQAVGVTVVANALFSGGQTLHAATTSGMTAVYGVNQQGDLFYVSCPAGSEGTASAWSNPVPILTNVEEIAPFLNNQANNSVIFAHISGANLIQLTQNPVTTEWAQRSILLPSTDPYDVVSYNSFTTHLTVKDEYNAPQANVSLSITSASPVTVYANDVFHTLSPTVPVKLTTDLTGVLTLVQETQSLSAVCYTVDAGNGVKAAIDPTSKLMGILANVQSGTDLGNVQVQDAKGKTRPLVPASVSSDQKTAAAEALKQFVQIASTLPADGSRKAPPAAAPRAALHPGVAPASAVFHVRFEPGGWTHAGSLAAAAPAGALAPRASIGDELGDLGKAITLAAGDLFNWLKNAFDDVVGFTIKAVGDVYQFFVKLGEDIYHVVLDCVSAVVHAVEFVFNKIKVFFEDLIAWLGFIFNWDDILRTHAVLKNLLKVYAQEAVSKIHSAENDVKQLFTGLEDKINAWAGLPTSGDTIGALQKGASAAPGSGSPQANWGLHHTKSNLDQTTTSHNPPSAGGWGAVKTIVDDLQNLIVEEGDAFMTAIQQLKSDVIDVHASLTPGEIIKRVTAILLDVVLKTAQNLIVTGLDIIAALIGGIVDLLDAPIKIPVISWIYREVAGADLSILDLMCLVAAIPVTIVYKIVAKAAPFPQNDLTEKMSKAASFADFKAALHGSAAPHAVAATPRAAMMMAAAPGSAQAGAMQAHVAAPVSGQPFDIMTISLDLAAGFGALLVVITSAAKRDKEVVPWWLNLASFAAYLPYIGPNITGALGSGVAEWYTILNDGVTLVAIAKTGLDALPDAEGSPWPKQISPWLECAINTVWLVPAIASLVYSDRANTTKHSDRLGFAGNLFFDLGGCISPAMYSENWAVKGEVAEIGKEVFFLAGIVLTGLYGIMFDAAAPVYAAGQ